MSAHRHRWHLHGFPRRVSGKMLAIIEYRCPCGRRKAQRTSRVRAVEVSR